MVRYFIIGSALFFVWLTYGFLTIFAFEIEPSLLVGLASMAGFVCIFLSLPRGKRTTKDILIAVAIFGIFMGGISCLRNLPVSRFKHAYAAIQIGMTRAEVEAVIRREFPRVSPPIHLNETDVFIGPPPDGPNAEFIGVDMKDGRVTDKHYLPD